MDRKEVDDLIERIKYLYTPENEEGLKQHMYRTYLGRETRLSDKKKDVIASLIAYNYSENKVDSTSTAPIDIANRIAGIQTQASLDAIRVEGSGSSGTTGDLIQGILNFREDQEHLHNMSCRHTKKINNKALIEVKLKDILDSSMDVSIMESDVEDWMLDSMIVYNPGRYKVPKKGKIQTYINFYLSAPRMEHYGIRLGRVVDLVHKSMGESLLGIYISSYRPSDTGVSIISILRLLSNAEFHEPSEMIKTVTTHKERKKEVILTETLKKVQTAKYGSYLESSKSETSTKIDRLKKQREIIANFETNMYGYLVYMYEVKYKILDLTITGLKNINDTNLVQHPLVNFITTARVLNNKTYINLNVGNMVRHSISRDDIINTIGLVPEPEKEEYLIIAEAPRKARMTDLKSVTDQEIARMISNVVVKSQIEQRSDKTILDLVGVIKRSLAPYILDMYVDKEFDNAVRKEIENTLLLDPDLSIFSVNNSFATVSSLFINALMDVSNSKTIIQHSIFSVIGRRDRCLITEGRMIDKEEYIEMLILDVDEYISDKVGRSLSKRRMSRFQEQQKIPSGKVHKNMNQFSLTETYTLSDVSMDLLIEYVSSVFGESVSEGDYRTYRQSILNAVSRYLYLDDSEENLYKAYTCISANQIRSYFSRQLANIFIQKYKDMSIFTAEPRTGLEPRVDKFIDRHIYIYNSDDETNVQLDINKHISRLRVEEQKYSGANLIGLLLTPGVDPTHIWTTNTHQMYNVYGVEIARAGVHAGIVEQIESLGSTIRPQHTEFLISAITHNAIPSGVKPRSGIFERTTFARQISEGYTDLSRLLLNRPPLKEDPFTRIIYGSADSPKPLAIKSRLEHFEREGIGRLSPVELTNDIYASPPTDITYTDVEGSINIGDIVYTPGDIGFEFYG